MHASHPNLLIQKTLVATIGLGGHSAFLKPDHRWHLAKKVWELSFFPSMRLCMPEIRCFGDQFEELTVNGTRKHSCNWVRVYNYTSHSLVLQRIFTCHHASHASSKPGWLGNASLSPLELTYNHGHCWNQLHRGFMISEDLTCRYGAT
jgi:hypothetical protein